MYISCAVFIVVILACGQASACTPVATMVFLLAGTTVYGATLGAGAGRPLMALAILVMAIVLKGILYSRFAGYKKGRAVYDMVGANIGSSIPGILIAASVASSAGTLPSIVIACLVLGIVAARAFAKNVRLMNPWLLSLLTSFAMIFSFALLLGAEHFDPGKIAQEGSAAVVYFAVKATGIFFGILAPLAISVVFEGALIFSAHRKNDSFPREKALRAILKANLYLFLALSVVGAMIALPHRWSSPGFLWIPPEGRF